MTKDVCYKDLKIAQSFGGFLWKLFLLSLMLPAVSCLIARMEPSDKVSWSYVVQTLGKFMLTGREKEALAFSKYSSSQALWLSLPSKYLRMLFHEVENNLSKFYLERVFKMKKSKNV